MNPSKKFYVGPLAVKDVNRIPGIKENAAVFMGRMQPPTIAHINIIEEASKKFGNTVVVAVVKSGNDKSPWEFDIISQIIKESTSVDVKLLEVGTGFIGDFISPLRDEGIEATVLLAGSDRVKGHNAQIERYQEEFSLSLTVEEIKRSNDDISASKVRTAIRENDIETFKSMTPIGEHKYFKQLQKDI